MPNRVEEGQLLYSVKARDYVDKISAAYDFASRSLLHLIVTEMKLVDRLRFGNYEGVCA